MTIDEWLHEASATLISAHIPTARLDAELILCHVLQTTRSWLIAHADDSFSLSITADALLARRIQREPLAYITGHKEFYGRDYVVTPDVLIPRPETETLIDMVREHKLSGQLLDVGTGSGCLGLTLALETDSQLTVCDVSQAALTVAKKNAQTLGVTPVHYVVSDLLAHWLGHNKSVSFDIIAANLPYVDQSWERSPETNHEPSLALFADKEGLELILRLVEQSPAILSPRGHLLLEADPVQHREIISFARNHGFLCTESRDYGILLELH